MQALLFLLSFISIALAGKPKKDHPVEKYLYVWVGGGCAFPDSTGCERDYIATIDVWRKSLTYNTVLNKAFLPDFVSGVYGTVDYYTKANEAHHMYLAKDYLVAAARAPGNSRTNAGTGAVFPGKADVFIFEIDPATKFPVFKFALDPPASCSDEITPINRRKTQFLVAHLCKSGNPGITGGSVSMIDIVSRTATPWMVNPPTITATSAADYGVGSFVFNPHSGDFDPNYGYVATNFVVPTTRRYGISLSHFAPNGYYIGEIAFDSADSTTDWSDYVNGVFDTAAPSSGSGFMDIKYIDDDGNLVTCASLQGKLYHVNVHNTPSTVRMALDIAGSINAGIRTFSGTTIRVIPGMNRIVATYGLRYIVLIAWDEDYNFEIKDSFDTCEILTCAAAATSTGVQVGTYSGAHYVKFSDDYETVYISTYYQAYPSTKRVLAFRLDADFNTLELETGVDRGTTPLLAPHNPHAIAYKRWSANNK